MATDESQPCMTTTDFAAYIDSIADTLQSKVEGMHQQINEKLEDMSTRIDTLEQTLVDVVKQMEVDEPTEKETPPSEAS
ncbi:hypothetical protein BDF14DRAFT_1881218 [Spinellus fusiger]|nr:hypothetical protein BDF14DRAFT_1881218 [Spinellus fusiger]